MPQFHRRSARCSAARRAFTVIAITAMLLGSAGASGTTAQQDDWIDASQVVPGADTQYFAESGHNLAEPFRSRWEQAGGEWVLGAPLSEERYAAGAGGVLQTFENLTLVYDPDQPYPFDVRGQRLDKTVWLQLAPRSAFSKVEGCLGDDCVFDAEAGHTMTGPIAEFWSAWGGAAIFGKPLTEPFVDNDAPGVLSAQLFESALLEDRGAEGVQLRPLGSELADENGLSQDPAFAPAPPTGGTTYLVNSGDGLRLRTAPSSEAPMVGVLDDGAEFIAVPRATSDWTPGYADGLAGYVATAYLTEPPPLPKLDPADWDPSIWQGAALGETNVRAEPSTAAPILRTAEYGDPLTVAAWVKGEEVYTGADLWAQLVNGGYVYGRNLGRNAPVLPTAPPPGAPAAGRWIDINLTQQLMTAYDGLAPMRTTEVTTGMAGWETPVGQYQILSRVANETMTSGAIGAENHYRLEDVLFTQYFTDYGHAIHFAWWRTKETIGRPGSHGCVNILLDDARYFWDFADIGTPVIIHY
ncbi:MAG: L,D-transpeptidase family protein [Thermomicrobiales bacterium]|nr:L,D-transpeptidase family protein [Thermomicrobiales bacterium]